MNRDPRQGSSRGGRHRAAGPGGAGRRARDRRGLPRGDPGGRAVLCPQRARRRRHRRRAARRPRRRAGRPARAVRLGGARGCHQRRAALAGPAGAGRGVADNGRGASTTARAARGRWRSADTASTGCASGSPRSVVASRRVRSRRAASGCSPRCRRDDQCDEPVIRLLIADDQSLVRGALAALLSLEDDFEVVAEVGRGDEVVAAALASQARRRAARHRDAGHRRHRRGRPRCGRRCRPAGCIVVTTFGRPGYLRRAMEAGASGFVVKDIPAEPARRRDPPGAGRAAGRRPGAGGRDAGDRGVAVDRRGSATCSWPPAAAAPWPTSRRLLFLSDGTVRNYLSSAIGKTGARTRAEAARVAEQHGWL